MKILCKNSDASRKKEFKYYAILWLNEIASEVKTSSYVKYKNIVDLYLLPRFGRISISRIDRNRVSEFSESMLTSGGSRGQGVAPSTVNTALTVLKRILEHSAQETGLPTLNFRTLRFNIKKPAIQVLKRSEQKKLWHYLRSNVTPMNLGILLCLTYGFRIGEVCAIRWSDVQLDDGVLSITHALTRIQTFAKKGNKTKLAITSLKSAYSERTIPLAQCDIDFLAHHRRQDDVYILADDAHKLVEPRTLRNHFKKILKVCGVRIVNFHALRHSFATRWIELGYDVKTLSEILGHSSVNVTLHYYVHPTAETKRQNLSNFSRNVFLSNK